MKTTFITICFLSLLHAGNACYAQDKSVSTAASAATTVADLAALNAYQVSLLKQVIAKGRNVQLVNNAQGMMADHQRLDLQLTAYANQHPVAASDAVKSRYESGMKGWEQRTPGEELDASFVDALVNGHQELVTMLDHLDHAGDERTKEFARLYIPIFKGHMDKLVLVRTQMNATSAPPVTESADGIKNEDTKFLTDMAAFNQYALLLMELTLAKSTNRDLKDAVVRMIEDHNQLTDRVNSFAKGKGYIINANDRNAYAAKTSKWGARRGGMEWDADMVEELIDVHKDAVDAINDAVTDVKDPEMKLLMTETMTTLNAHGATLATIKEKVKKPWNNKK